METIFFELLFPLAIFSKLGSNANKSLQIYCFLVSANKFLAN